MSRPYDTLAWQAVDWQRPFTVEEVWEMLSHTSTLRRRSPIIWEARGRNGQIRYQIGAYSQSIGSITDAIRAHGDIRIHPIPASSRKKVDVVQTIKVSHPVLSLNTSVTMSAIRAALAAMSATQGEEETVVQVILGRAFPPASVPQEFPNPEAKWYNAVLGNIRPATPEHRKSAKEKAEQHQFNVVIRLGASGKDAEYHVNSILSALQTLEAAGVKIRAEAEPADRLNNVHLPKHILLRLSVKELGSFLLLPAGEEPLPGTPELHPRELPPPKWYYHPVGRAGSRSFGVSLDPVNPQELVISPGDSLLHTLLVGPTGSGKSTAMEKLILADIRAGRSVLVIDPKADLVNSILARVPEERVDDVVVIDPSDSCPVGFNPLAFPGYENPPLIADAVLSVLKELWADNWGVRIQDMLSAALLTLVEVDGASLLWLPAFLTDEQFRQRITKNIKDKVALKPFWDNFDALNDFSRQQQIEPVLNKLRQFTLRPGLRNVLGQTKPKFSLTDLFYQRKIVLVPLNKGIIGGECARLLGSLIVGLTWTLALSRAKLPPEKRHMVAVYIDELQDYLSLPTDLSDALAQARGLGLSLTLAHQYRDQLPANIRAGIDANALNKIVFGLNATDAKAMAAMAPELTPEDFMRLPRYQVYASLQAGGRATGWIRGKTLPPEKAIRMPAELKAVSQKRFGKPAAEVEQEYLSVVNGAAAAPSEAPDAPIGRRKRC